MARYGWFLSDPEEEIAIKYPSYRLKSKNAALKDLQRYVWLNYGTKLEDLPPRVDIGIYPSSVNPEDIEEIRAGMVDAKILQSEKVSERKGLR